MRIVITLALLATPALAAEDDPDAFAVPQAAPLQIVPLLPGDGEDETASEDGASEEVERDAEGNPRTDTPRGKFAPAPPSAAPVPESAPAPESAPEPEPEPEPEPIPLAVPVAPTSAGTPDPSPKMAAPTPPSRPQAPAASPTPQQPTPTQAPPQQAADSEQDSASWSRRTGRQLRQSTRRVQIWWDRTFHGLEPAEERPPPPPPGASDAVPPFHAAAPTPPPDEDDRPLAIAGDAPPPPADRRRPEPEPVVAAQTPPEPAPAPEPAPEPEPEPNPEDEERSAGVWGGVHGAATSLDGGGARNQGFDIGFHIDRRFVLSGAVGAIDARSGSLELGYVGVRPGWVFAPDARLHPRIDFLWAIGAAADAPSAPFNLAEPRVGLELSLADWGRLEATVGHRFITPNHPRARAMSGITAGVGIRLGWF